MIISGVKIDIVKKNIKNMHLSVLPPEGIVRVSAPFTVDDETIRLFVISKIGWIKEQVERYESQLRQTKREYVDGETVYVWGKHYRLMVKTSNNKNMIKIVGDRLYLYVRETSTIIQRENALNKWYRYILKNEIQDLIHKWTTKMDISVKIWGVKNMKTKWGSCNTESKSIWLNLQLAKKPKNLLEYVVVHELAHLLAPKHDMQFVRYMDHFLPDWCARKEELNRFILDYIEPHK